jgi:cytochrome d ubiquinol oxidase subunit II
MIALALAVIWLNLGIERPEITTMAGKAAPSNPLNKVVTGHGPGWFSHFLKNPWMFGAPIAAFAGMLMAWLLGKGSASDRDAFLFSSLGIVGALLSVGFALFPFLLISTTDPNSSLTLWDASSSHKTLLIAFWITVVFLPIVLLYTRWVYKIIWGSITEKTVLQDSHTLY